MLSPLARRERATEPAGRSGVASPNVNAPMGDGPAGDVMERASTYALLFGFVFLIGGFVLATASPCASVSSLQVCVPLYQSTGNLLIAFGGIFFLAWMVFVALEEMRPRQP